MLLILNVPSCVEYSNITTQTVHSNVCLVKYAPTRKWVLILLFFINLIDRYSCDDD